MGISVDVMRIKRGSAGLHFNLLCFTICHSAVGVQHGDGSALYRNVASWVTGESKEMTITMLEAAFMPESGLLSSFTQIRRLPR